MGGSERLRLFCALRLPPDVVAGVAAWQAGALVRGRIVAPENLHLTLAFLGHRPAAELPAILEALRSAAAGASGPLRFAVSGYRETRSVGMLTFDDEGRRGAALAERLHARLEELGVYEREARPWLPHLTVLRFRERPRLRPEPPDLGVVVPSDAAVYMSTLRPKGGHGVPAGARYDVLDIAQLSQGR